MADKPLSRMAALRADFRDTGGFCDDSPGRGLDQSAELDNLARSYRTGNRVVRSFPVVLAGWAAALFRDVGVDSGNIFH